MSILKRLGKIRSFKILKDSATSILVTDVGEILVTKLYVADGFGRLRHQQSGPASSISENASSKFKREKSKDVTNIESLSPK